MPFGGEERNSGFGARNGELDPALLAIEGLVGEDAEAELFGVEGECTILIGNWNADEFDVLDHGARLSGTAKTVNVLLAAIVLCTIVNAMIGVDDYVIDVLMRDLVGHDRAPSAFLVYLYLWAAAE